MGIFKISHKDFLEEVHELIDAVDESKESWLEDFTAAIDDCVDRHKVSVTKGSSGSTYAAHLGKLIRVNRKRAHQLADSIGPEGNTWAGAIVIGLLALAIGWIWRICAIAAVVVLVLWALGKT